MLLEVSLKATPEDILLTMHPLVTFNLHAMARYFERAFGRADEDGLLAAIWNTLSECRISWSAKKRTSISLSPRRGKPARHPGQFESPRLRGAEPVSLDVRTFYSEQDARDS